MELINSIINNKENSNTDFAVHIKGEEELKGLIKVLEENHFEIQVNLFDEQLSEWMMRVAEEDNYNTCFRIRNRDNDKCVAWNPSIEHWRMYCASIIELENGEIIFHEGRYTKETAETEADKIMKDIGEGSCLGNIYGNKTKAQIVEALIKFGGQNVNT